jgi:lauroyl/myristoyl acyltransferase
MALVKKLLILALFSPLRVVIRHLPLGAVWRLGRLGGRVLCAISPERRALLEQELRATFPGRSPEEYRRLVRECFANYGLSEIEVLLYPALNRAFMERLVTIEGKEHLDGALAAGKGVLLFQAHFGAFQMVMPAIGYGGYRMNQISASAAVWQHSGVSDAPERMHAIKADYEERLPVQHINVAASMRPVFRALERNEIVGITVDGGGGRKTVRLPFLGRSANFQTGAPDLAVRTGAAIVPAFIVTEAGLRHRLTIHPPLRFDPSAGRDENRDGILRQFVGLLEQQVRRHPDHYGYTLCLRRLRARVDEYPFFEDYATTGGPAVDPPTTGSTNRCASETRP